LVGLGFTNCV